MKLLKTALGTTLFITLCDAKEHTDNNTSYIDDTHATISNTVMDWSGSLDDTISDWLGYDETNTTTLSDTEEDIIEKKVLYVDAFFQSNLYFPKRDTTNDFSII